MKEWTAPVVRYDVPFPPPTGRKVAQKWERTPSPWVAFLKSLKVGAYFEVGYFDVAVVRNNVRKLGMEVDVRHPKAAQLIHGSVPSKIWVRKAFNPNAEL